MKRPVLLVSSVTHAFKGQELLRQGGISCRIIRNTQFKTLGGCSYGLVTPLNPAAARRILSRGGIKVLGTVTAEVPV